MIKSGFLKNDVLGHLYSKYKPFDKISANQKKIFSVDSETSALECLKKLQKEKILCLPVMDIHHRDRIVGLIDVMDICSFVVTLYDRTKGVENEIHAVFSFDRVFTQILEGRKATEIMNYSGINYCYPLNHKSSLREVLNMICRNATHVPIVRQPSLMHCTGSTKRKLLRFITRTDILQFITLNFDLFGTAFDVSIQDAGVSTHDIFTVETTKKAIDCFRDIAFHRISAVAVINEEGILVENLSAHDIRLIMDDPQDTIQLPIGIFLEKKQSSGFVTCKATESMRHACNLMMESKSHRVWLVDDNGIPSGVLSLSDVVRYIKDMPVIHTHNQSAIHSRNEI
jgi:CBS domain-containing protein